MASAITATALAPATAATASATSFLIAKGAAHMIQVSTMAKITFAMAVTMLLLIAGFMAASFLKPAPKSPNALTAVSAAPQTVGAPAAPTTSASKSEMTQPPPTRDALVREIEAHEGQIRRLQMAMKFSGGSATAADFAEKKLGNDVQPLGDIQYAADWQAGLEQFKRTIPDMQYSVEILRNKQGWTTLAPSSPGSQQWNAEVTRIIPREMEMEEVRTIAGSGYRQIGRISLATAISTAGEVIIEREIAAGQETVKFTMRTGVPGTAGTGTQRQEGILTAYYRVWLLPQRGYLPARVEKLTPTNREDVSGPNRKKLAEVNLKPVTILFQDKLEEISPGIWFPREVTEYNMLMAENGGPSRSIRASIESVVINDKAKVPETLALPEGTQVTDSITGTKERVGTKPSGNLP
jgi:hypothetical protein